MVVAAILKNPKPEVVGRAHTCRMILYYLRSICTNFGALDQRVLKSSKFGAKPLDYYTVQRCSIQALRSPPVILLCYGLNLAQCQSSI